MDHLRGIAPGPRRISRLPGRCAPERLAIDSNARGARLQGVVLTDPSSAANWPIGVVGTADPPARHRVTLLGGFRLTIDDQMVGVPGSTQRIISLLALRGRSGRSRLAGSLWPETTEARALASLRTAIWRANQVSPRLVESANDSVNLTSDVQVDVLDLIRVAHEVLDERATVSLDIPCLSQIEADLLPDWNDEWLVVDRERLRQLRLHVLEALAAQLTRQGMFGMALEAALAALCADARRESAHRAVIKIHLAEGNLAEAAQAYQQCCAVLSREFGMPPSAETSQLMGTPVAPGGPGRLPGG